MSLVLDKTYRVIKREIGDEDVEAKKRRIAALFEQKREVESEFTAFRKWAEPRIRRALDPDYENSSLEAEAPLEISEAHGLRVELIMRRRLKTSTIAAIKAEMDALEAVAATRTEYRRIDCELVADDERLEVVYMDRDTGLEVDRRGMTDQERQTAFPIEEGNGKPKKSAKTAPEAVQ